MNEQFLAALQAENLPVSLDESLGRHTTFRIGGNGDFFFVPARVLRGSGCARLFPHSQRPRRARP